MKIWVASVYQRESYSLSIFRVQFLQTTRKYRDAANRAGLRSKRSQMTPGQNKQPHRPLAFIGVCECVSVFVAS